MKLDLRVHTHHSGNTTISPLNLIVGVAGSDSHTGWVHVGGLT